MKLDNSIAVVACIIICCNDPKIKKKSRQRREFAIQELLCLCFSVPHLNSYYFHRMKRDSNIFFFTRSVRSRFRYSVENSMGLDDSADNIETRPPMYYSTTSIE